MIAVILGSLFLIASVTWLLWSAFSPYAVWQRKDLLFQICYGMYGFMDLVCIGKTTMLNIHQLSLSISFSDFFFSPMRSSTECLGGLQFFLGEGVGEGKRSQYDCFSETVWRWYFDRVCWGRVDPG